jgi:hypothetical protein
VVLSDDKDPVIGVTAADSCESIAKTPFLALMAEKYYHLPTILNKENPKDHHVPNNVVIVAQKDNLDKDKSA